jgi:RNA-directed DNA polymerase
MIKSLPNLYSYLQLSKYELEHIVLNINSFYYELEKPKMKFGDVQKDTNENIKFRYLTPPISYLKDTQIKIFLLLQKLHLPKYMYGSVAGKNNILNALNHVHNRYFLTIDLKSFFTNITHHQVFKTYSANNFSPSVARRLTQLTTFKGTLPQGAPTSPVLANLTFLPTGNKLLALARKHHISFTTYLDDIVFSSKKCFKNLVGEFLNILREDGFIPHNQKIHYRRGTCEITGIFVNQDKLRVKKIMREKAQTNIHLKAYINRVELASNRIGADAKINRHS